MQDLIIISYKLTINVSSYLQEYIQYPVFYTYNKFIDVGLPLNSGNLGNKFYRSRTILTIQISPYFR